ncbi:MAG TPA: c-type cytochrome [Anaerolineales bacterium]|nr:c-type cytochrome [Anaerolineales bacterium]
MKFSRFITLSLFVTLLSACSSFSLAEDITPPPGSNLPAVQTTQPALSGSLYPLVSPNPANGEAIFVEKCAPCHGTTGQGDGEQASQLPNPPAAVGTEELARQASPAQWYAIITQGNLERFMPPFGSSLSERQRWDVVAFLYSLSTPPGAISQGRELYQANCASCHGPQGQGDGPQAADLETPPTDFTDQAFMAEKSADDLFQSISQGIDPGMPAYSGKLSEDERWALTDYLRSLTFVTSGESAALQSTPVPQETSIPEAPGITGTAEAAVAGTPEASTAALERGEVKGKVINASGGEIPQDLNITLHGFDNMQETVTMSTTVQTDGSFDFQNVEMAPGRAYIASVVYNDTVYGSDISTVEDGTTDLDMVVPIYETTTDTAVLSVDRLHIFFEYEEPDTLRVVELYVISNLSDRTLVSQEASKPVITFDLPEGATNLQFQDGSLGGRYTQTSTGFGDTAAIRPGSGQHQVVFAYDIPYKSKLDLRQPINLPVSAVVILVPEDGLKVRGDQLQDAGPQTVQDMTYHMYTSDQLSAGSTLAISISGNPSGGGLNLVSGSSSNLVIGLAAFGLALIVAGVWLYRRNQLLDRTALAQESGSIDSAVLSTAIPDDPDALMDAIIALDDLYQAGELPEQAYRERREAMKARLKEVLGS